MKYFRMSYEEVVFNRSYLNVILLNRSIPSYKSKTDEKNGSSNAPKQKFRHESEFFMQFM